jgi:hypothetical protein
VDAPLEYAYVNSLGWFCLVRTHDRYPDDYPLRSVHAGTNLSCDSSNRFSDGVVSRVTRPAVPSGGASPPPFEQRRLIRIFHSSTIAHHRRSGQVFTQDQEEMILIGAFGLFWFGGCSPLLSTSTSFVHCCHHSACLPSRKLTVRA